MQTVLEARPTNFLPDRRILYHHRADKLMEALKISSWRGSNRHIGPHARLSSNLFTHIDICGDTCYHLLRCGVVKPNLTEASMHAATQWSSDRCNMRTSYLLEEMGGGMRHAALRKGRREGLTGKVT